MTLARRILLLVAAVAAFALAAGVALAADGSSYEEKSLLASDGTLYLLRAGSATDLGISGGFSPSDRLIEWSLRKQDGTVQQGLIPETVNGDLKHDLQLAYDEPTRSLVLLWNEELTVLNVLRFGIFRDGAWSVANLLPNLGFAHAYNPQMLLSHQTVSVQDYYGNPSTRTQTLLSVIWWEQAQYAQARYAPIFLDGEATSDVQVYDLPALVGGGGAASATHPAGSYMYPSLQTEGIGGAILASFADLGSNKQYVARITYPTNLGKPGPDNATWLRRRIPVVGVASEGSIPDDVPVVVSGVRTVVGASYRPTLVWNTDTAVAYTHFDGKSWSSATIPLTDSMPYDRALRLVQEMATRN
jgi:hypothetical protein